MVAQIHQRVLAVVTVSSTSFAFSLSTETEIEIALKSKLNNFVPCIYEGHLENEPMFNTLILWFETEPKLPFEKTKMYLFN